MVQKRTIGFWATALLLGTLAIPAFGQTTPQPGGRGAQFMQQMNDRLKTQLGVTDDEYKALQPKIEAVMTAQRSTRGGGGFGGGRNRGGGQGGNNPGGTPAAADPNAPPPTPTQAATKDLQTTLDNKDAKPEEIKAKLTALRDARAKAKDELVKAQTELKDLLTQRQEAVLVNMGLLD